MKFFQVMPRVRDFCKENDIPYQVSYVFLIMDCFSIEPLKDGDGG